jgi:hypothetical protein
MTSQTSKPAFALITKMKDIDAAIGNIHNLGQNLQTEMHLVACSCLQHVGKHRDTRILTKLMLAMPDMARKNSLIQWFETFGNVQYSTDAKAFVIVADKAVRLGNAIEKPFWKFKANEGVPYEAIDLNKWLDQQIKKLEKDMKEVPMNPLGDKRTSVLIALRTLRNPPTAAMQ